VGIVVLANLLPLSAWLTLEFYSWPRAALFFVLLAIPIVLLGVRSLTGLGPVRKWVAIGTRLLVIALLVLILGGVRWQRQHKDLEVVFLRDVSQSAEQVTDHPGKDVLDGIVDYLNVVARRDDKPANDRVGVISFDNAATIDALPNPSLGLGTAAIRDTGSGTNVAASIQLALATMSKDVMHRFVLLWDGNATAGDLEGALAQAAAAHVPIDVMPLRYNVKHEVIVDNLAAPTWRRENEPFTIDVILRSTNDAPTTGTLTVRHQGEAMDLDPYTAGSQTTRKVTLKPGSNVEHVMVAALKSGGVHRFRATFDPDPMTAPGQTPVAIDTLTQNNAAEAFTFVRGKGKILYVDNTGGTEGDFLSDALAAEGIAIENQDHITPDRVPGSLVKLQDYDAVILANVPRGAGGLSEEQQANLTAYVHEMGGGLVMIGGPDSFGAGGWQGSKLEEILPVNMDIPAERQVGKGALVIIVHSCEFPNGNYWGEQCAIKASETLSAADDIGIITFGWQGGGSGWDYPLKAKGDGTQVVAAIKQMQVGDMPSFDDAMNVALNGKGNVKGLAANDAKKKHVIIISDGDPAPPNPKLVAQYQAAKVSVSTVSVYPHNMQGGQLPPNMKLIADSLKGKAYGPVNDNFNALPQIFIKEATIVRRSLIHEDKNGMAVSFADSASEMVTGINFGQPIYGMVLTALKKSPQVQEPLVVGQKRDPLLAQWQTGLGKAAVFTSDAHNKWLANYVGSNQFGKFWAQVVRSVARAPMSGDFDIQTSKVGDKGKITVEALNRDNAFLNFLNIRGSVLGPDGKSHEVRLVQTAPGIYTGEFDAPKQGTYAVGLQYSGSKSSGTLRSGLVVNDSPELRALRDNETAIRQVADRTGGRVLEPFDPSAADVFTRMGVKQSASPMPVWDLLLPFLLGLLLVDVAIRRIAWDWNSTRKVVLAGANYIRGFTQTTRKVENAGLFDRLKQTREQTVEKTAAAAQPAKPDASRKFEAGPEAAEGDITQVVGGATDKPLPSAPRKVEPKGLQGDAAGGMESLMEAKRRARERMQKRDEEDQ
jgi:uncharacterized membrane protein